MSDTSLRRFLVEDLEIENDFCVIRGREAHHMSRVLRKRKRDAVILLDGKGGRFLAEIQAVSGNAVSMRIKETMASATVPAIEITLCQAVIKSSAMDYLIQKTSELGVARILPFFSSRSVVHLGAERCKKKRHRWKEIAHGAAKQCNRDIPAEIGFPASFEEQLNLAGNTPGPKVILWEKENAEDLKTLLRDQGTPERFTGMVGPEGGFTAEEITRARHAGFVPVSMGSRILRAETAAMVLVTLVQYEWGDLQLLRGGSPHASTARSFANPTPH